jgi:hypothetical protein
MIASIFASTVSLVPFDPFDANCERFDSPVAFIGITRRLD